MRILADENITRVRECFESYGEVVTVAGRTITPEMLRDFDVLLVRSVTRVDASLLAKSHCRFVGTATSGIDHIDVDALQAAGIKLAWARGCNAISVVDYVFSALAALSLSSGVDWLTRSFGIVGCGQIGSALARRLVALGAPVKIYDPFLPESHEMAGHFRSFEEVLEQDIISLHVPLTCDGPFPTFHMMDANALAHIGDAAVLINAARGAVIDNKLLQKWLQDRPQQQVVLDAWEHEPGIALELLPRVNLGTPHIAGYSQQGKLQGTHMVLESFCEHFGLSLPATPDSLISEKKLLEPIKTEDAALQLNQLLLAAYDIRKDHAAMLTLSSSTAHATDFDLLRKRYPVRHEFSRFVVPGATLLPSAARAATALGFGIADQS